MSKILRLPAVLELTGLSRSSIYLRLAQGTFPKRVSLGSRAIGWRESDVVSWIETLSERGDAMPFALLIGFRTY
jgi:prophage regulatory protein